MKLLHSPRVDVRFVVPKRFVVGDKTCPHFGTYLSPSARLVPWDDKTCRYVHSEHVLSPFVIMLKSLTSV